MFKLLGVGALILLMLIPLLMIEGVLNDRLVRRNEAVADITASWGKEQNIIGPVLCVPYLHHGTVVRSVTLPDGRVETREVEETTVATAYFLPEALDITGDVQTQTLHRGIYDAAVFRGQITIAGRFRGARYGSPQDRPSRRAMERCSRYPGRERSTRDARRACPRLGRNQKTAAAGIAVAGVHPPGSQHHWQPTSRSRPTPFPLRSISMAAAGFSSLRSVCKIRCH